MSEMKPVKIYMDYFSQPSRAVLSVCMISQIPYEVVEIRLLKLENQKNEEFKKITPLRLVPAIYDPKYDLGLYESHAILRHLLTTREVKNKRLYPLDDPVRQAKINAYMDWHHHGLRNCAFYMINKMWGPMMNGPKRFFGSDPEVNKEATIKAIRFFEKNFIGNSKFIFFDDGPSVADILAVNEITNLNFDSFDLSPFPRLVEWVVEMMKIPEVFESHQVMVKMLKKANIQPYSFLVKPAL